MKLALTALHIRSVGVAALKGGCGCVISTGNMLASAPNLGSLPLPNAAAGLPLLQNRWLHTAKAVTCRCAAASYPAVSRGHAPRAGDVEHVHCVFLGCVRHCGALFVYYCSVDGGNKGVLTAVLRCSAADG